MPSDRANTRRGSMPATDTDRNASNPPFPRRNSRVHFDDDALENYSILSPPGLAARGERHNYREGEASFQAASPVADRPLAESYMRGNGDLEDAARAAEDRRASAQSDSTLNYEQSDPFKKYSISSYQHPHDIDAPSSARAPGTNHNTTRPLRPARRRSSCVDPRERRASSGSMALPEQSARPGLASRRLDLYYMQRQNAYSDDEGGDADSTYHRQPTLSRCSTLDYIERGLPRLRRVKSDVSATSSVLEPDDPRLTGRQLKHLEDEEDRKRLTYQNMEHKNLPYKARRKEALRVKIEYHISSMENRQKFLLRLAHALIGVGAPSHRTESLLGSAARILEVDAQFLQGPDHITCVFGDARLKTSETHIIKCSGGLKLTGMRELHMIYRRVLHDEISARRASKQIDKLIKEGPIYAMWTMCLISGAMSALICLLAFGGSIVDMCIAALAGFVLRICKTHGKKSTADCNVLETTTAIVVSLVARGLSAIRGDIFCYSAISSAGIVGILPGYMILISTLELGAGKTQSGTAKLGYTLIYTLFLGFGLEFGSDFFLAFSPTLRHHMQELANLVAPATSFTGHLMPDSVNGNYTQSMAGTWTFTSGASAASHDIVQGCYRPDSFPWWLQPLSWYWAFLLVPAYSLLSSMANQQKFRTREMVVMVAISCVSYAVNRIVNHFVLDHAAIVGFVGAFVTGVLGNLYSRWGKGTACQVMTTGVLFLVPSGLSQTGGLTSSSGTDVSKDMLTIAIGAISGLFMSQFLVYMTGHKNSGGSFSF